MTHSNSCVSNVYILFKIGLTVKLGGIDLIARVFVKYYLNPKGTNIYSNEKAIGTYYNGPTLSGVNKRYATDKNWANKVYSHMSYLYDKL